MPWKIALQKIMTTKFKILFFILLIAVLLGGFYYKDNIWGIYNNVGKNLQNFEKTDLGNIINEFKKEVFTPSPLNIGGEANNVVLVKEKIIAHTNIQRYDNGLLIPLIENEKLNLAAKTKAQDMFKNQYFEHISPLGIGPAELVKSFGYDYIVTGENLILGNFTGEQEVVQHWMDSPGHRANILNDRFTEIGVAVVKGNYKGQTVWISVQEFGLPLSSCPEPSASLKSQIDVNKNQLDLLFLKIENKRNEINNTNSRSQKYNDLVDEYNKLVAEYNALNTQTKGIILQYNNQVNNFNQCVAGN